MSAKMRSLYRITIKGEEEIYPRNHTKPHESKGHFVLFRVMRVDQYFLSLFCNQMLKSKSASELLKMTCVALSFCLLTAFAGCARTPSAESPQTARTELALRGI